MRLEPAELQAIRAAAAFAFGQDAVVRLFGSRTDDNRQGGDIDLHVEVSAELNEDAARTRFENNLFARMESQRVDVVFRRRDRPERGIDLIARRDGVIL